MKTDIKQELVRKPQAELQTTDSLPVLAAFNDFIKEEQRRARNQMLITGFLFTMMMLIIIGAGIFVGTAFYNQVRTDLRQTKNDLTSYHIKNEIEKNKANEKLSQIQALASNIAYNISQQKQALQATKSSIDSDKNSYQQELSNMKKAIGSLALENKKLKKETTEANNRLPKLTEQINDLLKIINSPVKEKETNTIAKKEPAAIKETKPAINNTNMTKTTDTGLSIKLNIEDKQDNSDIMMLLPAME